MSGAGSTVPNTLTSGPPTETSTALLPSPRGRTVRTVPQASVASAAAAAIERTSHLDSARPGMPSVIRRPARRRGPYLEPLEALQQITSELAAYAKSLIPQNAILV